MEEITELEREEFKKEKKEHPRASTKTVWKIVADHEREGVEGFKFGRMSKVPEGCPIKNRIWSKG